MASSGSTIGQKQSSYSPRKVKLSHVALMADVSIATASRVLRGQGSVAPETRDRVQKVAKVLGYSPDVMARALRTGQQTRILAIIQDFGSLDQGDADNTRCSSIAQSRPDSSVLADSAWVIAVDQIREKIAARNLVVVVVDRSNQELLESLPVAAVLVISTQPKVSDISLKNPTIPVFFLADEPVDEDRIMRSNQIFLGNVALDAAGLQWVVDSIGRANSGRG